MKIKPYWHQDVAMAHMAFNDFFALFMEQGTGKTLPTLMHLLGLYKQGSIKDALIICPKSGIGAWERDIEMFNKSDQSILNKVMTVINYDKVWRTQKGVNKFDKAWGAIVLDESHFIKNRASQRSKFILKLATKADYRYILTGTPIGNGQLENIWSQFTFLDPVLSNRGHVHSNIFGGSYSDFIKRYAILNRYFRPSTYVNVDELQDIIAEHSYRIKKEDCLDLPEKLPDEVIKVAQSERAIYKEMALESTVMKLDILADNALSRMAKLRQIASGFITDNYQEVHELKSEKISVLDEILEGLDKKVVIFCEFKHSIKSVSKLLTNRDTKHVILDGDQKDKNIWRQFQSDESIQAIIVQYQSGSAGIDLFASDTIIYYEPTLRSTTLEQSRDRIHRSGQTSKCSYIHLITRGTIEVDIYRALSGFSDFSEKVFVEYMSHYNKGWTSK